MPRLEKTSMLCTVDVVGFYPSIPHDEGLLTIGKKISTDSLMHLTEMVLRNNIFEFDNKVYKQLQGTAMGTKMAPSYAVLFMDKLERQFLDTMQYKPRNWWRYIDDIFWEHGEEKLGEFMKALNSFHKTIKFTFECSMDSVNFLDV